MYHPESFARFVQLSEFLCAKIHINLNVLLSSATTRLRTRRRNNHKKITFRDCCRGPVFCCCCCGRANMRGFSCFGWTATKTSPNPAENFVRPILAGQRTHARKSIPAGGGVCVCVLKRKPFCCSGERAGELAFGSKPKRLLPTPRKMFALAFDEHPLVLASAGVKQVLWRTKGIPPGATDDLARALQWSHAWRTVAVSVGFGGGSCCCCKQPLNLASACALCSKGMAKLPPPVSVGIRLTAHARNISIHHTRTHGRTDINHSSLSLYPSL